MSEVHIIQVTFLFVSELVIEIDILAYNLYLFQSSLN